MMTLRREGLLDYFVDSEGSRWGIEQLWLELVTYSL